MMIIIGVASAIGSVASHPRWRLSTFLTVLFDLFAFETVVFGLADIVALLGYWPKAYADYELPRYLPLATALFGVAIFGISHFAFVRRMVALSDPFFEAQTPISIRPWPLPRIAVRQSLYARVNVFFLILINQFQVALGVRLNFFYREFGNAIQVPDAVHQAAFWQQLLMVFIPLVTISILAFLVEFFVALNFVLQWRRWMTASYTSRWLLHSMHYKLALSRRPDRQPGPAHLRGHRRLHQRRGRRRRLHERGHLQLHDPGDDHRDQSGRVLDYPVGNLAQHGHLGLRHSDPRVPFLGRDSLRLLRHRHDASDRPLAVAADVPPAGGRGRLPLRPRPHPRVQRADRPAQRRAAGDRSRRPGVQQRLHHSPAHHSRADHAQFIPAILYPDFGDHSLCGGRAVLFRGEKGRFRHVQPGGRRLQQRQHRHELFRQPIYRPRQLQRDDPAPDLVRGGLRPYPRGRSGDAPHRRGADRGARTCP